MKNVIIAILSVTLVFLMAGTYVLTISVDQSRAMAATSHADVHRLLEVNARMETANDICLNLVESQLASRGSVIREVLDVGDDEVRSGSRGVNKGGAGDRGARTTAFR